MHTNLAGAASVINCDPWPTFPCALIHTHHGDRSAWKTRRLSLGLAIPSSNTNPTPRSLKCCMSTHALTPSSPPISSSGPLLYISELGPNGVWEGKVLNNKRTPDDMDGAFGDPVLVGFQESDGLQVGRPNAFHVLASSCYNVAVDYFSFERVAFPFVCEHGHNVSMRV
jgi:hypothetical protein